MRKTHTRIIGTIAAVLAAGLAGFALRTPQRSTYALASRNPAPDVRTQVIRRTIHIVRHDHSGQGPSRHRTQVSLGGGAAPTVRTHTSGSHVLGTSDPTVPVTTRTSASHKTASGSHPVTTRTSSHGTTGGTVTTRSSGGGHDDGGDGGGHDN